MLLEVVKAIAQGWPTFWFHAPISFF